MKMLIFAVLCLALVSEINECPVIFVLGIRPRRCHLFDKLEHDQELHGDGSQRNSNITERQFGRLQDVRQGRVGVLELD